MTGSADRPPVRIVHIGLGAFHRAHQVWFTQHGDPEWGVAAFSGRSARLAETLTAQDCRYTLVERGPEFDAHHRMSSLVAAYGADRQDVLDRLVAGPEVAVVTLTITEAGYADPAAPRRLVQALDARRRSGAGPIAVVPCDNVLANGARARSALLDQADGDLAGWIDEHVSFVDTVSDRITPATTADDVARLAALGVEDRAPVVTEPFAEWVLAGEFPAGRPAWERAGAVFTDDIRPFERRKLRLLNGAHLLLALAGLARGHGTVADAMTDPVLTEHVEQYWAVASRGVPEADEYVRQLRTRFTNGRIRHALAQIALDAENKLRERVVPLVRDLLADGADPGPALRVVDAWLVHTGQNTDSLDRLAPGWAADPRIHHDGRCRS
ncbi:mannitol dehydrogenase family protein [Lentzea sp. NBRC 102530]|uniref:mannitol dehydrogenase family protein n=1 Tax=Lentzea sp. NBRC 102530 TaxID=3032201 RepID=UPI0024A050E6|nr:mannitol dehydrogenase family protein [Lentzea sp. NBRC 102530]GLY47737.1 mannitol-1-phosphate 5-dehydrogenase [Lentzea sp. NBRC 102530]